MIDIPVVDEYTLGTSEPTTYAPDAQGARFQNDGRTYLLIQNLDTVTNGGLGTSALFFLEADRNFVCGFPHRYPEPDAPFTEPNEIVPDSKWKSPVFLPARFNSAGGWARITFDDPAHAATYIRIAALRLSAAQIGGAR